MSSKNSVAFWGRLDVRLTVYYTSIFLILSTLVCCFFFYRVGYNLLKQMNKVLMDETSEFINLVYRNDGDLLRACQVYEQNNSHRKYYPVYFRVLTRDGKIFFESADVKKLATSPFEPRRIPILQLLKLIGGAHPYRYFKEKFTLNNGATYTIQIAADIQRIKVTLRNVLENILIVIPILLMLSVIWGLFLSKKYRELVNSIVNITNRITSQNLQERLPVPAISDEFQRLTSTINSMIDRLEQAFREVKQFTADVSHELRTPLFALKGELEVALSQKRNDDEYREAIAEALERINILIKLVNDLFLISRFDVKKMDLEMVYLNSGEIVRDLYDFYLPVAQDKNLQFRIERCDDVVIYGDRTRMHQLLSNLLDNAIKFTPENGSVTIALLKQEGAAQFRVSDTGIGIRTADLPNLFNRFYQGDKARSGAHRGAGLGLHICKRIAEAHGSIIDVESNKKKGVTFIVTIPIKE